MSSDKVNLIKNAIKENTRYLTGDNTYKLYEYMTKEGFIKTGKIINKEDEKDKIDYKETIIANFNSKNQKLINYFEEHEYKKAYKYGVAREINISYDELDNRLNDLVKSSDITTTPNEYDGYFKKPRLMKYDDAFYLKFSYIIGNKNDKSNSFAYPIIAIIIPKNNVLLILFDSVPYTYYTKSDYYQYIAKSIKSWIETYLKVNTKEIKLLEMVKDIINIKNKDKNQFVDIKEYIRDGYDKRGGRFKMIADENDEMSFLEQLNKIADSLSSEKDKNKLKKFIHDFSTNMKFIERGLTWKKYKERKSTMTMTFRENFIPNEMVLIHFYENNWERERVLYGIDYIVNYKTKII